MPKTSYQTVDAYISAAAPEVQPVLTEIRRLVTTAIPEAHETISYQMPALKLQRPFFYFGAFKHHIGIYPPIRDRELKVEVAPYANEKGNLRFPLNAPIPYDLIVRIAVSQAQHEEVEQE